MGYHTNRILDAKPIQLCFTETTPDFRRIYRFRKSSCPINADDMFDQDVDGVTVRLSLLVNLERFLVETRVDGNIRNLGGIVVVEFLDVIPDAGRIGFDGCENHEVLQMLVLAEGRWFEDNLFEQLDQLIWQVGVQECLDGNGDIIWIRAFWDCGSGNLMSDGHGVEVNT